MSEARQTRTAAGVIGTRLGSVARHALDSKSRGRFLRATAAGVGATAKAVARTTHILWLEVTGLLFFLFALVCGSAGWREYHKALASQSALHKVYLAGALAFLFTWFGVSSFWRARRR